MFIPLSLLDQILSAEFILKISQLFGGKKLTPIGLFWHPAQLIESYKSCPLVALKMSIFLAFQFIMPDRVNAHHTVVKYELLGNVCIHSWQRKYIFGALNPLIINPTDSKLNGKKGTNCPLCTHCYLQHQNIEKRSLSNLCHFVTLSRICLRLRPSAYLSLNLGTNLIISRIPQRISKIIFV